MIVNVLRIYTCFLEEVVFEFFVDLKLYLEDSRFLKKESKLAGSNFFENLYININV